MKYFVGQNAVAISVQAVVHALAMPISGNEGTGPKKDGCMAWIICQKRIQESSHWRHQQQLDRGNAKSTHIMGRRALMVLLKENNQRTADRVGASLQTLKYFADMIEESAFKIPRSPLPPQPNSWQYLDTNCAGEPRPGAACSPEVLTWPNSRRLCPPRRCAMRRKIRFQT